MRTRKYPMTPLAAVAGGLLAGAVGTVCLDTVQYVKYRRAGGTKSPLAWEFAPVETWDKVLEWNFTEPKVRWFGGGQLK